MSFHFSALRCSWALRADLGLLDWAHEQPRPLAESDRGLLVAYTGLVARRICLDSNQCWTPFRGPGKRSRGRLADTGRPTQIWASNLRWSAQNNERSW
ncbi:MAG: hypothetical protein QOH56_3915 [Pseudonocardiales bacterium]|nr:hypothetical protein [Pseudonocardiales bacterium]